MNNLLKALAVAAGTAMLPMLALAQTGENWYRAYAGKIMGANAAIFLHKTAKDVQGHIVLANDPRPYALNYETQWKDKDSMVLNGYRSPGIHLRLTVKLSGNSFAGRGVLLVDPSMSNEPRPVRSGAVQLSEGGAGFTPFRFFMADENATFPAKVQVPPTLNYESRTVWPASDTAQAAWMKTVRKFIADSWEPPLAQPVTQAGLTERKNRVVAAWRKDIAATTLKELATWGAAAASTEQSTWVMVLNEDPLYISLVERNYSYTGGAHGNYAYRLASVDKRLGKALKPADILTPQGIQALPGLLEKALRAQFGWTNTQSLEQNGALVKSIKPNDNFYVANGGMGFLYNPYEILPFVYGDVLVIIPIAQVAPYIRPEYIKPR